MEQNENNTTIIAELRNLVKATTDFGNALNNIIGEGINFGLDKIENSIKRKKIKKIKNGEKQTLSK
ncbi:MAG: hypothetical protein LBL93_00210 [Ruminococcus sp.]|jgi:hypothetical protein|nr:hypothetical protein [Ruminococcus sp.]